MTNKLLPHSPKVVPNSNQSGLFFQTKTVVCPAEILLVLFGRNENLKFSAA